MFKVFIGLFLFIIMGVATAAEPSLGNHPPIIKWKKFTTPKGFVLYKYLVNNSGCFDNDIPYVWDYHAYKFKEKNPDILDIDNIDAGRVINLQTCKKVEKKKVITPVKESPIVEKVEDQKEQENLPPQDAWGSSNSRLFVGLGFISESYEDYITTSPALTFRVNTDIHDRLGHRLMIDGGQSQVMIRNKIDFKTDPTKYQFFLSVGMGNRIGLVKHDKIKLSSNITTYAEYSLGMNLRFENHMVYSVEIGSTINSKNPINFSVTAMKKLGDSPYYLGGYFDYVWTDSSMLEKDSNGRKILTGGVIFSY